MRAVMNSGLYCVPNAIPAELRPAHFARLKMLFTEDLLAAQREDTGYTYHLPADRLGEIGLFVQFERHCCPFLDFSIEAPAGSAEAILRVSGPTGTPEFLEAEFGHGKAVL